MHGVATELAVDERVVRRDLDVAQTQQLTCRTDEGRAHLHRGRTRFWIDAALVRDTHHQVEVAHRLAKHARRYVT
jgi:hypothetical protein